MTNGDKIRQMSDEEIIDFFFGENAHLTYIVVPHVEIHGNMQIRTEKAITYADWMKEEWID